MNDSKCLIKKYIEALLKREITRLAIYPYGKVGKCIESICYNEYPNIEYVIFDKNYDDQKIYNPQKITEYKDYYFLIATINKGIKNQVIANLLNQDIEDKNIIKIFDYDELFIDDRTNRVVDYELINPIRHLRTEEKNFLNSKKYNVNEEIIVSLTTFPARIDYIEPTLQSIFQQSLRPDKVILWLAEEEFPNKIASLPDYLTQIEHDFFEIRWCKNFKSYKKLIPTLLSYPDAIIVTADDDLIYGNDWLKKLYDTHLEYPEDIICHRITKMVKDRNGKWATLPGGFEYYSGACYLNKLCGGSGTLYPIGCLIDDVKDNRLFSNLAPTSDDIWFWLMGVAAGCKVRAARNPEARLYVNNQLRETPALTNINDRGEKLFWVHFYQILNVYPEILEKLEDEYISRKGVLES